LNILLSVPTLIAGIVLFVLFLIGGVAVLPALPILGSIGTGLLLFCALFSIPGLILGWGLLNYAPWARIFGIVVSLLNLVSLHTFGIGTVLGIYSLFVLFHPETVALFEGRQVQTS
jgi:hypothetical protein